MIKWDKCLGGKRENRLVPSTPVCSQRLRQTTWRFTHFPSPGSPYWPTLQLLPQLRKAQLPDTHSSSTWVSPDTPLSHPCTGPDTDRRLTLSEDLTVLQEKRFLNLFHESLLKISLELTVSKARNPDRGLYKRGAALPP